MTNSSHTNIFIQARLSTESPGFRLSVASKICIKYRHRITLQPVLHCASVKTPRFAVNMIFSEMKTSYDARAKIWSGAKLKLLYGPESSIGSAALQVLMSDPDHIAQICYGNGKQYTNREIANLSIRVAQHLKKLGVEQCEIIGLCASNSDYVAPLFFGAMLCGLTVSTLDPSFDKDGIKHIYSITKPKRMFCDGSIYARVKEAFEEINLDAKIYTMKDHIDGVPAITEFLQATGHEASFKPEPLKLGYTQTAAILCSSGTTGLPKGVCTSHAALLNFRVFKMMHGDSILSFSTLYWASGLFCLVNGTLDNYTRIISDRGFSPDDFFDIIQKHKVQVLFTPPSQIAMSVTSPKLKSADLSSVTFYLCGGSAVSYSLAQKILPYMPNAQIISGYGMSEVSDGIAYGKILPDGSTGQIGINIEVKIMANDGTFLGPGEKGEICVRTLFPWAGYYGNPEATAAIYTKDGWLYSGDVGYVDDEGNMHIIDRKKEILKYNNFHFSPTEIENVIIEMAGVAEVSVCGLADDVSTHLPAAAIVRTPGSSLTEEQVYDYVAERMAHFKHLRGGVYFLNNLPKTVSGKNLRRVVTTICEKLRSAK